MLPLTWVSWLGSGKVATGILYIAFFRPLSKVAVTVPSEPMATLLSLPRRRPSWSILVISMSGVSRVEAYWVRPSLLPTVPRFRLMLLSDAPEVQPVMLSGVAVEPPSIDCSVPSPLNTTVMLVGLRVPVGVLLSVPS